MACFGAGRGGFALKFVIRPPFGPGLPPGIAERPGLSGRPGPERKNEEFPLWAVVFSLAGPGLLKKTGLSASGPNLPGGFFWNLGA